MKHAFKSYLRLLDTFTNEEKINEIDEMIYLINPDKAIDGLKDNRYDVIKSLKQIKNRISL